jgi:Domain of unknown function (DUF4907)
MPSIIKMTDKKKRLIFALIPVFVAVAITLSGRGHFYVVSVFKSGDGWGYDIMKKDKIYIHQPYMPALEGQVPFRNKNSARKTGRLVIKKIKNRKSPAITPEEIKSIILN